MCRRRSSASSTAESKCTNPPGPLTLNPDLSLVILVSLVSDSTWTPCRADDKTLEEYSVVAGDTLHLVLALRGGGGCCC